MGTNYDNEMRIIKEIHELEISSCLILSDVEESKNYNKTIEVLNTLLCDDYLDRWKDNSFSHLPPDFLNDKDNLMIEVMRIDDHSFDGKYNPVLEKERHLSKELEPFKKMFPNANFFINAVTDLPTNEDHNYMNYYLSFQRTIRKHKSKITKYRKNYPDKKLIFVVMDETSGVYFEKKENNLGKIHMIFFDNRFVNEFIESDIDYLIIYSPFNHFNVIGPHLELPHLVIFDVKNLKDSSMMKYIDYDESKMTSSER